MTTVVDPAGSPDPVYNRSGTTIVNLTASGDASAGPSGATPIVSYSGVTIALVTIPDGNNIGVVLPTNAEIGDVVEVNRYQDNSSGSTVRVWTPSGVTIVQNTPLQVSIATYRKISATEWSGIGA